MHVFLIWNKNNASKNMVLWGKIMGYEMESVDGAWHEAACHPWMVE